MNHHSKTLTIKLMKFTLTLTLLALVVLILIPENIYTWLFSKDFTDVKPIIVALRPGVLALAANHIFSHYFSGLGNPKVNLRSNIVGLIFTIVLAFTWIPVLGYIGAAITASVSYSVTVAYQYYIFKKQTQTELSEWIPGKKDFRDFVRLMREAFGKQ